MRAQSTFRNIATLSVILTLALPQSAFAALLRWKSAVNGTASDGTKWDTGNAPTSTDTVKFNLKGTYQVTWDKNTPQTGSHVYDLGVVTVDGTSKHAVNSNFIVGDAANSTPTVIMSGFWSIGDRYILGKTSTADVDFTLTGEKSLIRSTSTANPAELGSAGTATFLLDDGASFESDGGITFGVNDTSSVTAEIKGVGPNDGLPTTLKITDGVDEYIVIGLDGDADVTVSDGATLLAPRLIIGQNETSNSSLTIAGAQDDTIVEVTDCDIGESQSKLTNGGLARLAVTSDHGFLNVADTIRVGDLQNPGHGRLEISTGGEVHCKSLDLRNGLLDFTDGRLFVTDGKMLAPQTVPFVLDGGLDGLPLLVLDHVSAGGFNQPVLIGDEGQGNLQLYNSAMSVDLSSGERFVIGNGSQSSGFVSINATSSLSLNGTDATLVVGNGGDGTLELSGNASAAVLRVGVGGAGIANLGLGADLQLSDHFEVGKTDSDEWSDLYIAGNSNVDVAGATTSTVLSKGRLTLSDSTLSLASTLEVHGQLNMTGGTLTVPNFVSANAIVRGSGLIDGDVAMQDSVLQVTGGILTAGDAASETGFDMASGLIDISGGGELVILDSNGASFDNVALNDGTITCENPLRLRAGKSMTLSGPGTVNAHIIPDGNIAFDGFTLRINGFLQGVGQGVSGGRLELGFAGGFLTHGLLDVSQFVALSGSAVHLNGDTEIGRANSDLLVFTGNLDVDDHNVTLHDSNGVDFFGEVKIDGGTIITTKIKQDAQSHFFGNGVLDASWECAGTIEPRIHAGTASMSVTGSLSLQSGAVLDMQIGADGNDRIDVKHVAEFNSVGTLRLSAFDNYTPQPGDTFTLVSYFSRTGRLATIDNALPGELRPVLVYGDKSLTLNFAATGDVNCDGGVDFTDIDAFVLALADPGAYAKTYPNCGILTGDINNDGATDFNDIDGFVNCLINSGCS